MSEAKLWSRVVRGKNYLGVLLYGLVMSYEGTRKHIPPFGKGKCPNSNSWIWEGQMWSFLSEGTKHEVHHHDGLPKIDLPPGVRAMDWTWNCQVLWPQHGVHDLRHDEYHYGVSVNFYRFHDAWESKRLIFQPFPGGSWSLGWCSRSFLFGLPIPKQPEPGKQPHRLSQ